jgi:hypothetical protein
VSRRHLAVIAGFAVLVPLLATTLTAQAPAPGPVTVGSPVSDFTLPAYQGGDITLSGLRGRIVMIVLPRGLASASGWCHVCNYQHAELADYDTRQQ